MICLLACLFHCYSLFLVCLVYLNEFDVMAANRRSC